MCRLEVKNLHKNYGRVEALKNVSMCLKEGIYGLIGVNGAGKSTLFKILTTSLEASNGEIYYDGKNIKSDITNYRKKIGYMPQQHKSYDHLSAKQFLFYMAALKGMDKKEAEIQIQELSEKVHLNHVLQRKIGTYSGGMCQRLMFIQALLGNPKILILDEPTSGLDPYERISMRNHIFDVSNNKIVLIATHVMQDIEYIADELILLKEGELFVQTKCENLVESLDGLVHEQIIDEKELDTFKENKKIARMTKTNNGVRIRYISKEKEKPCVAADLEDVYLHYISK